MTRMRLAIVLCAAAGCASRAPRVFPVRELASGPSSGMPLATQRVFKTAEEYERFAGGLRGRGEFPLSPPSIDWSREWLVVAFGGPSRAGERVTVLNASEMGDALIVRVRREAGAPEETEAEDPLGAPNPKTTPYVIAAIPRYNGPVRFLAR